MREKTYMERRSEQALAIREAFAQAYNNLFRSRVKEGKSLYGIKVKAAAMAGFGSNSLTDKAAYKTQRVKATQMMNDPLVIEKLKELGLKPHPFKKNEWVLEEDQNNVFL
jgi:hypothetical protein